MIMLLALLALGLLMVIILAGVCMFHWGVGNGRFETLDCSRWGGLFGTLRKD